MEKKCRTPIPVIRPPNYLKINFLTVICKESVVCSFLDRGFEEIGDIADQLSGVLEGLAISGNEGYTI